MAATGKDSEFTEFVELHSDSLRRTAYLLAGNRQGAEDLLQDALVKAWLKWKHIDPTTGTAYVRKIMSNLVIDRWRRRRYEAVPVEMHENQPDEYAAASFVDSDHCDDIVRQLRTLTPRERTAVVLRYTTICQRQRLRASSASR